MSKKIISWSVVGALFGYFVFHPLVHFISMLHFPGGVSDTTNFVSEILQAFSISMLPWSLSFIILSALLGLFWGKIQQADKEKSEAIKDLRKALEKVKILSGFLPI